MKKQEKTKTVAEQVFNALENTMTYLYGRWLDESAYEDFADYEKVMKREIEKIQGAEFLKGTKRPFGCHFKVGEKIYEYTVNTRNIGYKRIR